MKQKVVVFGATGSLGKEFLEVLGEREDLYQVIGLSAGLNRLGIVRLSEDYPDAGLYLDASTGGDGDTFVAKREDLVTSDADVVFFGEGGVGCKEALLKAIAMKKKILLANKELLVSFGEDIMYLAREMDVELLPVDSELCAVHQALKGEVGRAVRRVFLTASGGALRGRPWTELAEVQPDEVLRHPTWKMGKKITVDSATMVNKAFEVVESHYLFGLKYEQIEVRLHPQSLVHAIVEFEDGFSKMMVSEPDMKRCLRYLLGPRLNEDLDALKYADGALFDFDVGLDFMRLPPGTFPCFDLVHHIAVERPDLLSEMVRADEHAVADFLSGKISYHAILDRLLEVFDSGRRRFKHSERVDSVTRNV